MHWPCPRPDIFHKRLRRYINLNMTVFWRLQWNTGLWLELPVCSCLILFLVNVRTLRHKSSSLRVPRPRQFVWLARNCVEATGRTHCKRSAYRWGNQRVFRKGFNFPKTSFTSTLGAPTIKLFSASHSNSLDFSNDIRTESAASVKIRSKLLNNKMLAFSWWPVWNTLDFWKPCVLLQIKTDCHCFVLFREAYSYF